MSTTGGVNSVAYALEDTSENTIIISSVVPATIPSGYLSINGDQLATNYAFASGMYDSTGTVYRTDGSSWASATGQFLSITGTGTMAPASAGGFGSNVYEIKTFTLSSTSPVALTNGPGYSLIQITNWNLIVDGYPQLTLAVPNTSSYPYPYTRIIATYNQSTPPFDIRLIDGIIRMGTMDYTYGFSYPRKIDFVCSGLTGANWNPVCPVAFSYYVKRAVEVAGFTVFSSGVAATNRGISCCVSGNGLVAAIGNGSNSGLAGYVYIYTRVAGGSWTIRDSLTGSTSFTGYTNAILLGYSVALNYDGSLLAVGCPGYNSNEGCVYYGYYSAGWSFTQLIPQTGTAYNGTSVAVSADGSTLAIGCPGYTGTGFSGTAVMYRAIVTTTFVRSTTLAYAGYTLGNTTTSWFGFSLALNYDGTVVWMGGPNDTKAGTGQGAVLFFQLISATYTYVGNFTVSGTHANYAFGYSLACDQTGKYCFIGAPGQGAVYLASGSTGILTSANQLTITAPVTIGTGFSVACSSTAKTVMVGCPGVNLGTLGASWTSPISAVPGTSTGNGDVECLIGDPSVTAVSGISYYQVNAINTIVTSGLQGTANVHFPGYGIGLSGDGSISIGITGVNTSAYYIYGFTTN